jgi:hypothetical protein
MTRAEIDYSVELVKNIAEIVTREFVSRDLHVIDGKF